LLPLLITCVALRTGKLAKQETQEEKSDLAQKETDKVHVEELVQSKQAKLAEETPKTEDKSADDSKDQDGKIELNIIISVQTTDLSAVRKCGVI
jgi:ABC-type transport system involved in cytochrome bd biosynthesis fused ATPase/permease subunit